MGHKTTKATEIYARISDDARRDATEAIAARIAELTAPPEDLQRAPSADLPPHSGAVGDLAAEDGGALASALETMVGLHRAGVISDATLREISDLASGSVRVCG
ncbi:MAG: hypothetical protein Q8Q88_08170 [Phenylobacterium sp.]|uniref:hypothetical protein n=1 Tax=Phenylobacterium sp. TaxID=1871053 RepID=UPI002734126D|nr:hypothetical protein [Phenylobacterium sp.]MDP3747010.1 hypothetical protein [Phenylobacterium sp.]